MDFTQIPRFVDWAKAHAWLAIFLMLLSSIGYGGYAFIGGYAGKFGESLINKKYDDFTHTVASFAVIDQIMHNYLQQYKGSRIGVARFHNSVRDIGSNSMFFVSFENIITAPGVESDLTDIRTLPAIVYANVLPKLLTGEIVFERIDKLPASMVKDLAMKHGTKAIMYVPMNDLTDHLVGMIVISWITESDIPSDAERARLDKAMLEGALRIGAYFSAAREAG